MFYKTFNEAGNINGSARVLKKLIELEMSFAYGIITSSGKNGGTICGCF